MVTLSECREAIRLAKFMDEQSAVQGLLQQEPYDRDSANRITNQAEKLVSVAREDSRSRSLLDTFVAEYGLSNAEGIALMCLAESLLRVPDQTTANQLIADKVGFADWTAHVGKADSHLVNASTWGLMLTGKLVTVDRGFTTNPKQWLIQLGNRLTEPVIQSAMRGAMQILGQEFVLGKTIERALHRADQSVPYSYDMLGEAARTAAIAAQYQAAYAQAIEAVAASNQTPGCAKSSVSIKLSALHPRYEYANHDRVMLELVPAVRELCMLAAKQKTELTMDAEESDRLDLSLDVFEALAQDDALSDWSGLGIAVQAYGKRSLSVLGWLAALSQTLDHRIPVRLVKGAYWDAEIKHAQVMGYPGFPVFTRKASTDLSYLVCARFLLAHPKEFRTQFATHNAHTIAAIMEMAPRDSDFEFQRLHGMGDTVYAAAQSVYSSLPQIRTYAPVGEYDDLLAYLVRRLLENGANSSFVNRFLDNSLPPAEIVLDPVQTVRGFSQMAHPGVLMPAQIFGTERANSNGMDLTNPTTAVQIQEQCGRLSNSRFRAASLVCGKSGGGSGNKILNPANIKEIVGECVTQSNHDIDTAFSLAAREQLAWAEQGGDGRAFVLSGVADRLESERQKFIALLCREAGKTIPDALAEVREAVDFCRYYAVQAKRLFADSDPLPGPTGELNEYSLQGRGVFVCISPWNFPLAIFVGQIAGALAAGNTVIAKPAPETPLVAYETVCLLHSTGVPVNACQLIIGDGAVGAALVAHPLVSGVAFTGSTDTARKINLTLAQRTGPIVPLIAETGGQNAMIVDSTALLEQVADDVIQSAFSSAGQRCSALRVLCLQEDVADLAIKMIRGAMDELIVGHPARLATDVGPIISNAAAQALEDHIAAMSEQGHLMHRVKLSAEAEAGHFVAPTMIEIESLDQLSKEHFGPILHVVRYKQNNLDEMLQSINNMGYGLTLGVHSRIESRTRQIAKTAQVGNVYINRNITGAVVGSQPFGGQGLSGTGPKVGGPHYLLRFATEKVVSTNTVAVGGNAELLLLDAAVATES